MSESSYFTLPQLAERWQVSVVTLRRRIKAGNLKHVAIGRLFRIERDEVERIERQMREV
jgi:excisionase family DNA binding protein